MDFLLGVYLALIGQTVRVETTTVTTIKYEQSENRSADAVKHLPSKAPFDYIEDGRVWVGHISHYSQAGCLGCPPHYDENGELYYVTSSGERFDENKMALAFNQLPNGSWVRVTNMDNGKSAEAVVNDKGGFEQPPYNRIADLTVGLGNHLGTKTDKSKVKIELIEK